MKMQNKLRKPPLNKILLSTFLILLGVNLALAQPNEIELQVPIPYTVSFDEQLEQNSYKKPKEAATQNLDKTQSVRVAIELEQEKTFYKFVEDNLKIGSKEKSTGKTQIKDFSDTEIPSQIKKEKFHWEVALIESGVFLGFQHGFRMMQKKTRRELGGPFFRDWKQSVKNLRGWGDGDNIFTNYIAHPGQGAITGRIFINNSDRSKKQEFGKSKKYWESRLKAMAWSAAWSTQFELGPISEASLGNVGLRQKNGHSTMAYVDLVMTPITGTGLVIAEDAVDKYFLRNWLEKKTSNKFVIKIFRSLSTPTTSIANMLHLKRPWKRDSRPLN
jgi:hypothetical protein